MINNYKHSSARITNKNNLTFLGIWVDRKCNYSKHIMNYQDLPLMINRKEFIIIFKLKIKVTVTYPHLTYLFHMWSKAN